MALTTAPVELITLDDGVTITVDDNSDTLTLVSTDADASVGPVLTLNRNSASPADSDVIAAIDFDGRNDAAQAVQYAQIIGQIFDVSDGTEDAALYLQTIVAGTTRERLSLKPTESVLNEASVDLDFRVESDGNTHMLFVDAGNNRVGVGTLPTDGTLHVLTASAGTVSASTQADDIVIENSAEGGMTIITPDDQSARIRFTSPSTNTDVGGASIFYRQNINKMNIGTEVAGGILALHSGAASETMRLDANGHVTMPNQSAFSANKVDSNTGISINTDQTIVFNNEIFDQNSDFNTTNYTFTAPVTGKYQLSGYIRIDNFDESADYYILAIQTSNRPYYQIFDFDGLGSDPAYLSMQIAVLADMDANDTAYVRVHQAGGAAQASYNVGAGSNGFQGYLVA